MRGLGSVTRALRRLVGRSRAEPGVDDVSRAQSAAHEAILRTIAEQRAAQKRTARERVRRADLERAVRQQRRLLVQAGEQISDAVAVAGRAGADARAARENAQPYEQTVVGLQSQLSVVEAAVAELDRNGDQALATVARAQRLLDETGRALDAALRAQVSLLGRLERLQRQRAIAEATLRAREEGRPGGP